MDTKRVLRVLIACVLGTALVLVGSAGRAEAAPPEPLNVLVFTPTTQTVGDTVYGRGGIEYVYGTDAFASIQEAIDAVGSDGEVQVAAGTYEEHITISKGGLTLEGPQAGVDARGRSGDGDEAVIIGSVKVTSDASSVAIDGFKFQTFGGDNPYGLGGPYNTALVSDADTAVIVNNLFVGAKILQGPYTYSSLVNMNGADLTLQYNQVHQVIDTASDANAAYINITADGSGEVTDNTFTGALGIGLQDNAAVTVLDNVVLDAPREGIWFWPVTGTASVTLEGGTVGDYNAGAHAFMTALKMVSRPASVNGETTSGEMLAAMEDDNPGIGSVYLQWMMVRDGESIQAAIDAASPGDTIEVAAGTYAENLIVDGKNVSLYGAGSEESGSSSTIVQGVADYKPILEVKNASSLTVKGFRFSGKDNGKTLRGVYAYDDPITVDIQDNSFVFINDSGVLVGDGQSESVVSNNEFVRETRNSVTRGGSAPGFWNCTGGTISDNTSVTDGVGIFLYGCDGTLVENNVIAGGRAPGGELLVSDEAIHVQGSTNVRVVGNTITDFMGGAAASYNAGKSGVGVVVHGSGSGVEITDNNLAACSQAVSLRGCSEVHVHSNTYNGNKWDVLIANGATGNTIYDEDFTTASTAGVQILAVGTYPEEPWGIKNVTAASIDNVIYGSVFAQGGGVDGCGENQWDNGADQGNTWGDFSNNEGFPARYSVPGGGGSADLYPAGRNEDTGNIHVDSVLGSDSNLGIADNPVKSIGRALQIVSADGTVHVAAGMYDETFKVEKGVTIKGSGIDETVIKPSAALLATGVAHKYDLNMQVVAFVNDATGVHIQDMTIDGNNLGANAVVFWNASSGSLDRVKVMNPKAFDGVQTGQGIAVDAGSGKATTLAVNDCEILNFNKNGIDAVNGNGAESGGGSITVNVSGGSITGHGETEAIAQNGVLFWERAGGSVGGSLSGVAISKFEYTGTDDASGVLLYAVKSGTVTLTNTLFSDSEKYIALAAGSTATVAVDTCTFDDQVPGSTPSHLGLIEDKIDHKMDDESLGTVYITPKTLVVTENNLGIQAGVNAAVAGDTVLVMANAEGHAYTGNVNVNKDGIEVISVEDQAAHIKGNVTVSANDVHLKGFKITDFAQIPTTDYSGVYIPSGIGILIENNVIDGTGLDPLANLTVGVHTLYGKAAEATIQGNTIRNVRMGIYNQGANLTIIGNTIEGAAHCGIGVDSKATTISGSNTITGGDIGLEVFGPADVSLGGASFIGNAKYILLSAGTKSIDASTCTFDGVAPATATNEQLGAIEDKVDHVLDTATAGVVSLKQGTLVVTENTRGIQAAIDAAQPANTVLVMTNTEGHAYTGNVNVNKAGIEVISVEDQAAHIMGNVTVSANDVHLRGFKITDFARIPTPDYSGVYIPSGTGILVENNVIDGTGLDPLANLTVGVHTLYGGSAEATIQGNTIRNVRMGIYNQGANLTIIGNTIDGATHCGIGVDSKDTTITGINTITGGDVGLEVFGPGEVGLDGASFSGNAKYILLSAGTKNIDASTCTFDGVAPATATNEQLGAIEDKVNHVLDTPTAGVVSLKQGTLVVTENTLGIQAAVSAAQDGNTILVRPGTYQGSVIITKPVTLRSTDGADVTIVDGNHASENYYMVNIKADNVTVDGFTITNPIYAGTADAAGVVIGSESRNSNIRVTKCVIHDIGTPTRAPVSFGTFGFNIGPVDGLEIDHNRIYNIKNGDGSQRAIGIFTWGNDSTDTTANVNIHDNVIEEVSNPGTSVYGISTGFFGTDITVSGNRVTGVKTGVRVCDDMEGPVIVLDNTVENATVCGVRLDGKLAQTVTGNTVTGCATGILVKESCDTTEAEISGNIISGNTLGMENLSAAVADATLNYWGDAAGPTVSNLSGMVRFSPWLDAVGGDERYADATFTDAYASATGKLTIQVTVPGTVDKASFKVKGATVIAESPEPNVFAVDLYEGENTVEFSLEDEAGNVYLGSCEGTRDSVPAVTALTVSGAPDGLNGWYKTKPTVTLSTESGATIKYWWDDSEVSAKEAVGSVVIQASDVPEREHTLRYRSTDSNGNKEATKSKAFKVDTIAPAMPTISVTDPATLAGGVVKSATAKFTVAAETGAVIEAKVNGISVSEDAGKFTAALMEGSNTIEARATDQAGHRSGWKSFALTRDSKGPKININTSQVGSTVAVEVIPSDANGPITVVSSTVKIGDGAADALALTEDSGTWKGSFSLPSGTVPFTITVTATDGLGNTNTASYMAAYINATEGGTVSSGTGGAGSTTVVVPPNALESNTTITVTEATDVDLNEGTMNVTVPPQQFGPSGTTFQQQIRITFEYDVDTDETKLGVYYWDEEANGDQGGWVYLGGDISGLDNTISIDTDHFSVYGVFEDTTPPALTVTNRDALDGSVTKNAKVTVEGTTEAGAQVTVNGVAVPVTPTGANLGSFSIQVPISEGSNDITVVATDWADNEAEETFTVIRDSSCPFTVTVPVSGSQTKATTVTVLGSSEVGATVTVRLGGVVKAQEVLTEEDFDIVLAGLQPGDNVIRIEAEDALGNKATAVELTMVVDTTNPALTITSPVNDLITRAAAVEVVGSTEPDADVALKVNDGEWVPASEQDGGDFRHSVPLRDGSNTIVVKATDPNVSTVVLTVTRDNERPDLTVSIVGDEHNGWLTGSPTVSILDASDANKYYYSLNGGVNWNTYPGNGVQLPEGDYYLACWAIDPAGNDVTEFTHVQVDTVKPVVTVLKHDATKHLKEGEELNITLQGEYQIGKTYNAKAFIAGKEITLTDPAKKGLYTGTYTVQDGDNLASAGLTAELTDQAGNVSTIAAAERVTLDTTPPSGTVSVNNGAARTANRTLYVTVTAEGASKMKVVSTVDPATPDFTGAAWESIGNKSIMIPDVRGTHSIYVKFVDLAGNESQVYSDDIEYLPASAQDGGAGPVVVPGETTLPPVIAGAVSEEVTPEAGGTVTLADNSAKVQMPAGATTEAVTVTLGPVVDLAQPTTGMVKIGNRVYEIIAETATGAVVRTFSKPLTLTFTYTEQELSDSGIAEEDLRVFYWDEDANAWIALPTVVDAETGTVSATTDHFTVFALMAKPGMPALQDTHGHWAETYVLRLVSLGVVGGYEDGSYRPEAGITRQEFAKMVVLAAGLEPDAAPSLTFADNDQISDWARGYVSAAVKAGIITGLGDNRFGPAEPVTRAQAATMIARALGTEASGTAIAFADGETIPTWAQSAIQVAVEKGIINGFEDNTFRPELNATRAQAAKMLSQLTVVRLEK